MTTWVIPALRDYGVSCRRASVSTANGRTKKGMAKIVSSSQSCGIPAAPPLLPTIHHSELRKAKTTRVMSRFLASRNYQWQCSVDDQAMLISGGTPLIRLVVNQAEG